MKCDICNQEFANSKEVEDHKERDHPVGERDEELEAPDLLDAPQQPQG